MNLFGWLQRLTGFDRKLVSLVGLLVLSSFLLPLSQGVGAQLVVSSGYKILFVASLDQAQLVEISGPVYRSGRRFAHFRSVTALVSARPG